MSTTRTEQRRSTDKDTSIQFNAKQSKAVKGMESTQWQCNASHCHGNQMRVQCNAKHCKQNSQSKANARQCGTHQGNTEQCEQGNVKHKAIHMQMRRRALPSNTVQRKTMQELSEPQELREPREPGTGTRDGEPNQRFRGSRAEGRKCHRPLSREKEGGERNAEGRRTMEKRGYRRNGG